MARRTRTGTDPAAEMAARVRALLDGCPDGELSEKRMFGVLAFLLNGNLLCYVSKHGLTVRLARDDKAAARAGPEGERCVVPGRRMPGYVLVANSLAATKRQIQPWLGAALDYVGTLPKK